MQLLNKGYKNSVVSCRSFNSFSRKDQEISVEAHCCYIFLNFRIEFLFFFIKHFIPSTVRGHI